MLLIITIGIAVVLFCYQYLWKPQLYWRNKNVIQNTPIPLLGDSAKSTFQQESVIDMLKNAYSKFEGHRYAGIYQATLPTLVIRDPDLIKQITVKDFDFFMNHKNFFDDKLDPIWNKNLVLLKDDKWKTMRATLSPTFTSSKMRLMFELMENSAKQYVQFYLDQDQQVIELELKDSFSRVANDVIANCAFGVTVDSLKDDKNQFYLYGKEITDFSGIWNMLKFMTIFFFPKIAKSLNLSVLPQYTVAFFKKLVTDSVSYRETNKIIRPDMINLLMEARKGTLRYEESTMQDDSGFATVEESDVGKKHHIQAAMTEDDMTAQVIIFFFAGFDTVSTMLTFMCYELALNIDIQQKLHEEIDQTIQSTNGSLTYDVLNKMKYLDMVVCESLRMHPPAPILDREVTKPYTIEPINPNEKPVHLEVGSGIWLPVIGIQHDEKYYPNPNKFDPERFSEENKHKINPYTYLPFGVGPRNCIGSRFALMEVKTLMYHILSKFELVVIEKTSIPIKYHKGNFAPTFADGCWIGLKRRQNI